MDVFTLGGQKILIECPTCTFSIPTQLLPHALPIPSLRSACSPYFAARYLSRGLGHVSGVNPAGVPGLYATYYGKEPNKC